MNAQCNAEFVDGFDRWTLVQRKKNKMESAWSFAGVDLPFSTRTAVSPGQTYSKRSTKLHQLRLDAASVARADFDDCFAVTAIAMNTSEAFINSLWEGCLDFELAVSHDGEINFLYGDSAEFFHIHIDEEGSLSYYSLTGGAERMGSNLDPSSFPQKELLSFIDRRK